MTPMMRQYRQIKAEHQDCFLFFRLGDFYEMFEEDAIKAAPLLGVTLTRRKNKNGEIPMCGIPHHSSFGYIKKLTNLGYKIALCEQISEPQAKGIVERAVTKIITPGTLIDEHIIDDIDDNILASIVQDKSNFGICLVDVSTGHIEFDTCSQHELKDLLHTTTIRELVIGQDLAINHECLSKWDVPHDAKACIQKHYELQAITSLGTSTKAEIKAIALALDYLTYTQKQTIAHLKLPKKSHTKNALILDSTTIAHLELLQTSTGNKKHALIHTINHTATPMGFRKFKHTILHPIRDQKIILTRQSHIELLLTKHELRNTLKPHLKSLGDTQRLIAKIVSSSCNARDLSNLKEVFIAIGAIDELVQGTILEFAPMQEGATGVVDAIGSTIVDEPPLTIMEGGMIQTGVHPELDQYVELLTHTKQKLMELQMKLREETNIPSLKIKFSKMVGYCIEVSKIHLDKVPAHFIQKQTLTNANRYITEEVQKFETLLLEAQDKRYTLEYQIFQGLVMQVKEHTKALQKRSEDIAYLDTMLSFALLARQENYSKPIFVDSPTDLTIEKGKHPVLSYQNFDYIPTNYTCDEASQIQLLTGPNMGGKSTYLRMIGLTCLLAHTGSFVPVVSMKLPLLDRIFTRVGAGDDITQGHSTFMVEMAETAKILNYATPNSLILLDEIGRGTSTYDGLSLAWSIVEYIHDRISARTVFATHYHELVQVVTDLSHGQNISVQVQKHKDSVVFLYEVARVAASESFGIEVAKMAGIPLSITKRAKQLLKALESQGKSSEQLDVFAAAAEEEEVKVSHPVLDALAEVDPNSLSPMEALELVFELKKEM